MKTVEASQVTIGLDDTVAQELERLKRSLNLGHELTVKWLPGQNEKLCGEVKGNCIYIYEEDEKSALEALKHEFLDDRSIEPYQRVANRLIGSINEEAYQKKERLIEVLSKLV